MLLEATYVVISERPQALSLKALESVDAHISEGKM